MTSIYFTHTASQEMKREAFCEKELLQAALCFDQHALAQIYDLYSPELYQYATRFLGDPCVAEDCVADTFSNFLRAIHNGRGPKEFLKAYLYRSAHNWIADYYRRGRDMAELNETQPDKEVCLEKEVDLHIRQAQMRKAILKLTPDQQRVIVFKYLQDWKNEDIARMLHKPIGAVKSLQYRALASLKKILEKEKIE